MKKSTEVRSFAILIVLLVTALIVSSCGIVSQQEEELPVIRYVNFKVYDPVYVGIDKGFYEREGCKVEIIGDVIAGPNAIQAVAAGSAEAGLSSIPAIVNANAAGLPIQGVVDIQTTLPGQALQRWYVRADSDIQKLEDVIGRTYAVNIWRSSFHYTSLLAMDQRGMNPDDVNFQLLSFSDQILALIEGEVDVIGLIQPYQAYLEDEFGDQIRELYNDYDDVYGTRHVSLIFVNRLWAQYNPEQAECFVTGTSKAIDWIEENQDDARQIVSKYTGIPPASVRDYHFTPQGRVRLEDVQVWLDYLIERGDVADWVDLDMVVSDSYNKNK